MNDVVIVEDVGTEEDTGNVTVAPIVCVSKRVKVCVTATVTVSVTVRGEAITGTSLKTVVVVKDVATKAVVDGGEEP